MVDLTHVLSAFMEKWALHRWWNDYLCTVLSDLASSSTEGKIGSQPSAVYNRHSTNFAALLNLHRILAVKLFNVMTVILKNIG
jgi:hypothetical protein